MATKEEFEGYLVETDGGAIIAIHAKQYEASKHSSKINRAAPGAAKRFNRKVRVTVERAED